jgi:hypothetical protein
MLSKVVDCWRCASAAAATTLDSELASACVIRMRRCGGKELTACGDGGRPRRGKARSAVLAPVRVDYDEVRGFEERSTYHQPTLVALGEFFLDVHPVRRVKSLLAPNAPLTHVDWVQWRRFKLTTACAAGDMRPQPP